MSNETTATPYELWHGSKQEYGQLQVFVYVAYICIQKSELNVWKFDSGVRKFVFVSYNSSTLMRGVFYAPSRHIIYLRDVVLFENQSYYKINADTEVFDTENNSVQTLEYEDKVDPSEVQFFYIFQ